MKAFALLLVLIFAVFSVALGKPQENTYYRTLNKLPKNGKMYKIIDTSDQATEENWQMFLRTIEDFKRNPWGTADS